MKSTLTKILLAEIKAAGLPAPELEFKFHPTRKFRFDLAWPIDMVALEIHGAVWAQGRHTRGGGFESDREKVNTATLLGWRVLEYSTGQIKQGAPIKDLQELFS